MPYLMRSASSDAVRPVERALVAAVARRVGALVGGDDDDRLLVRGVSSSWSTSSRMRLLVYASWAQAYRRSGSLRSASVG